MYVKRIQVANYGAIEQLDITLPVDDDGPKPVVLVGENGSGKSVLLSHIVNALLLAQQSTYGKTPEVKIGKVYKLRSPNYIASGKEFFFRTRRLSRQSLVRRVATEEPQAELR